MAGVTASPAAPLRSAMTATTSYRLPAASGPEPDASSRDSRPPVSVVASLGLLGLLPIPTGLLVVRIGLAVEPVTGVGGLLGSWLLGVGVVAASPAIATRGARAIAGLGGRIPPVR